jgi:pimeloyl-ACP methyl ester carboxylesterase
VSASPSETAPATPSGETPFFFESHDRPLYAVYHAPRVARADAPALVHCHSLGVEQVTVYRAEVLMARSAAALGVPVLRYHSRGHGDSAGDFADVTLERLAEDAAAAAAEVRRRSGAGRVAWLGVRFGALVAARAATRDPRSAGIALWEPAHRAMDFFRSQLRAMLFSQVAAGRRPDATVDELLATVEREGKLDVHGYYLHRAILESARDEDLALTLAGWSGPTLVAQIQARPKLSPANAALAADLERRGARVEVFRVAEEPGWWYIANPAWESAPLVRQTAGWLDALA